MLSNDNALLEKAFHLLSGIYFDGLLPDVMITIQSSPKAYGHFTLHKIWLASEESYHEINISAEYLSRPLENVMATLLHEMVHLYCMENGIQDVSQNGRYHNKRFKEEAEKRGLLIEKMGYAGYSKTTPGEELIQTLKEHGLLEMEIDHHRLDPFAPMPTTATGGGDGSTGIDTGKAGKKKSSTRKYVCPACKTNVRATKEVNLICGDCMCTMERMD